VIHWLYL